jgi:hypothetical protein
MLNSTVKKSTRARFLLMQMSAGGLSFREVINGKMKFSETLSNRL